MKEPTELQIQNIKTLPTNNLENVREKFTKVNRVLYNYFSTKEALDEFMKKQLNLDTEEFNQVNLSQKNLVQIFGGFFSNIEEKRISRKDLEGFLSVLNYNDYGYAKAKSISETIYK